MDARGLIILADRIRNDQNMSQAEWSRAAGMDASGSKICRAYKKGDCKLSSMVELLRPLGYELTITRLEDLP